MFEHDHAAAARGGFWIKPDGSTIPVLNAALALLTAFVWADTEEGQGYWADVYRKLNAMSGMRTAPHPFIKRINDIAAEMEAA